MFIEITTIEDLEFIELRTNIKSDIEFINTIYFDTSNNKYQLIVEDKIVRRHEIINVTDYCLLQLNEDYEFIIAYDKKRIFKGMCYYRSRCPTQIVKVYGEPPQTGFNLFSSIESANEYWKAYKEFQDSHKNDWN